MERSFDLGREQEDYIDEAVRAGRFETPDDVVRESLRLLKEREASLARLNARIMESIAAADRGELIDCNEAFDKLDAMIDEMADKAA